MRKSKLLYSIVLLISPILSLNASESRQEILRYEFQNTSDGFSRRATKLNFDLNRRNSTWPYEKEKKTSWDFGGDLVQHRENADFSEIQGLSLSGFIGRKFSEKYYLKIGSIYHEVQKNNGRKEDNIGYQVYGAFNEKKIGSFTLEAKDDYVYQDMVLPGGISNLMTGQRYKTSTLLTGLKKIRSRTDFKHIKFNDKNRVYDIDSEVKYQIGPEGSWFWVGANRNFIKNERTQSSYWSPRRFFSYSLRLEGSRRPPAPATRTPGNSATSWWMRKT